MKEGIDNKQKVRHTVKRLYTYSKKAFWKWGIWRWIGGLFSASLNILIARMIGQMLDIAVGKNISPDNLNSYSSDSFRNR